MSSPDNPQFDPQPLVRVELPDSPPIPPEQFGTLSFASDLGAPPPVENPLWSGWDVLLIALLTVASIVVLELATVVVAMRFVYPHTGFGDVALKPIVGLVSEFLAYIAVLTYMVMLVQGKYRAEFWRAIQWNWPRAAWKFLGIGVLVLFAVNLLGHFLPMPKSTPFDQFFARPRDAYLTSVFAIGFGPLMEELFFRGFLYPVLARRTGVFWGIILTALPFGLIHMFQYGYAWGLVSLIFLMGVVCTAVRAVTKSVGASFLVHVGYNATEMILFALVTDGFRHMEKLGAALRIL